VGHGVATLGNFFLALYFLDTVIAVFMGYLGGFNPWLYTHCNLIPIKGLGL
jgi:hypothetical protein